MLHKTRETNLNHKNSNIKIYYPVKVMNGNIHTLKFQYTALETRTYDQLKTTETDKGNYLSHDKCVIVVPLLHKCKIFYFSVEPHSKEVPSKDIDSVTPVTIIGSFPVNPCLTDRTTLLFDIKSSHLGTIFPGTDRRYSAKWGDKFPRLRYSNHKDAGVCINCLAFGSHTDRNEVFTGLGFRELKNTTGLKRGILILRS